MAVQVKTKAKAAPAPIVESTEEGQSILDPSKLSIEELADLYGSLEDQTTALLANPVFTKFEQIKKELTARLAEDFEPTDSLTITGSKWLLDVGAAAKNPGKLTDVAKLMSFLGVETFCKLAKVNLTDITKYCTPEQVSQVVDSDTGYSNRRKITAKFVG